MSDTEAILESNDSVGAKPRRRFPYVLTLWTLFIVGLLYFLDSRFEWLNEQINLDLGVVRIGSLVLTSLTVFFWWLWLTFFCGMPRRIRFLLGGVAVIFVASFFLFVKRVSDGDMGFIRYEPRFWSSGKELVGVAKDGPVRLIDLAVTSDSDFPQFLGPNRNAAIPGRQLTHDWVANPPRELWKQPVGLGWSGFVVVNGCALTQEQRGPNECVTCYDLATGELLWVNQIAARHEDTLGLGRVGPRATPAIDSGRVYAQGATGWLQCLNGKDGSVIWKVFLPDLLGVEMVKGKNFEGLDYDFENSPLTWGRANAPLVYEDKVVVAGGGPSGGPFQTLFAFDKLTGEKIWSGGDSMISYGSPSVASVLGEPQLLVMAESQAIGFSPSDGRILWTHGRSGSSNGDANCSQVTWVADDQLLMTKGYAKGGELIRLGREENEWVVDPLWKNSRVLKTKFTNPVLLDGFAYALSDGFLECTDMATGKRQWKKRGRFGHGQLLLVGSDLLIQSEHGVLYLVAASPEGYKQFGEMKTIDGVCWNTLCLSGDYLVVRSEAEVACYRLVFETVAVNESTAAAEDEAGADEPKVQPANSSDVQSGQKD